MREATFDHPSSVPLCDLPVGLTGFPDPPFDISACSGKPGFGLPPRRSRFPPPDTWAPFFRVKSTAWARGIVVHLTPPPAYHPVCKWGTFFPPSGVSRPGFCLASGRFAHNGQAHEEADAPSRTLVMLQTARRMKPSFFSFSVPLTVR